MLAMYIIVENKFWAGKDFFLTGILAVAKPCSIIVEVKELFGSESKSQVYAHLHELLLKPTLKDIHVGEYL